MAKFIATQMKDLAFSGDGTEVPFTIVTKHAGEMVFTMPASRWTPLSSLTGLSKH